MVTPPVCSIATLATNSYRLTLVDGSPLDYLDWRQGSGGTVEIYDIVVGSERRKGIGKKLVEALFRSMHSNARVWAITRSDNMIAQQFYEALLFNVVGVLRRFYADDGRGVDAIMYGRRAGGPI